MVFLGIGYRYGSKHRVDQRVIENVPRISEHGYPVVARPVVQPWEEHHELLDASAKLIAMRSRVVGGMSPDPRASTPALSADRAESLDPPLPSSTHETRPTVEIVGADVIVSEAGPKFIGFSGSGLAAVAQYESQRRIWRHVASEIGGPEPIGSDPFEFLAQAIEKICRERGWRSSAVLLYSGDDPNFNHTLLEASVNFLNERGIESASLDVRSRHLETESDGVKFPSALFGFSDWPTITYRSVRNRLSLGERQVMSFPPEGEGALESVPSALVLALLSEGEIPWMSTSDRALIERFVPWTRVIRDIEVQWRSESGHILDILTANRESFVVKNTSRSGATRVHFGRECSATAWRGILRSAASSGSDVAQEVVDSVRVQTEIIYDEHGASDLVTARMVVQPFCIDGVAVGARALASASSGGLEISSRTGAAAGCVLGTPTWL